MEQTKPSVDWDALFGNKYLKLTSGIPKRLRLTNWKPQTQFKDDKDELRPGLEFTCIEEDGAILRGEEVKSYVVTAIKALLKLRPIIEEADRLGDKEIYVQVIRVGEGRQTVYEIVNLRGQKRLNEEAVV